MQLSGYGLPRIPLPRTPVNKGKRESRGFYEPRPSYLALELCVSPISPYARQPHPL